MSRKHTWIAGTCVKCGMMRARRTVKLRMAITSTPPYDHYKYESHMAYLPYGRSEWTFKRPDCK
jgi:hypothetical protein